MSWFLAAIEKHLTQDGWQLNKGSSEIDHWHSIHWELAKENRTRTLIISYLVLPEEGIQPSSCRIEGYAIHLNWWSDTDRDWWTSRFREFVEDLNSLSIQSARDQLRLKSISPAKAIEIAQNYLDQDSQHRYVLDKNVPPQYTDRWIDGHRNIDHPCWLVGATWNGDHGMDGSYLLTIAISLKTGQVEDARSI